MFEEKMNSKQSLFLQIIKASLTGSYIENPEVLKNLSSDEWLDLVSMAETHKVLPLVYEVVHGYMAELAPELNLKLKNRNRQLIMMQTLKTADFLALYKQLDETGIRPLVVKGIVCRILYPKPDLRMSSDEDLLIDSDGFKTCQDTFEKAGLYTDDETYVLEHSYEISYRKKDSPLYIELHKHLFPVKDSIYSNWNEFFKDAHANAVVEMINGVAVHSLEYTDHLFYLICHAFKHFLHSGFGIRQVCDIVMYANAYGDRIDWNRISGNCKKIRADIFAEAIFKIGEKHLNFDRILACYPSEWDNGIDEYPMLEDLLNAGIYGSSDMSRKHSSNITLNAAWAAQQGRSGKNSVLKTIFPSAKNLVGTYPYLQKYPWLLPLAWTQRLFKYGRETAGKKNNSAREAVKIGQQRVELLKLYGVIEE